MTFLGLRLPVLLLFLVGFPLFWLAWIGLYAISPVPPVPQQQIDVVIPARSSVAAIQKTLADKQLIKDDDRFTMLAGLLGVAHKLQAGEFSITAGLRPYEVLSILNQGKVLYRPVTIPEGTELVKIAAIFAQGGWGKDSRFLELAGNRGFIQQLGVHAKSLEGYLFPDTYYLSKGQQGEADIIQMMVAKQQQVFADIMQDKTRGPGGLTKHEILTLASIVEKETGLAQERGLVARVFLNRLARGMRLQADPTVRYATGRFDGALTRRDLQEESPYNTYYTNGLPPGPICSPGRASIEAVVHPDDAEYLYFVAKDTAGHHFSKTLQEHNQAVARYRQKNN